MIVNLMTVMHDDRRDHCHDDHWPDVDSTFSL